MRRKAMINVSRRNFLQLTGLATAGLALGCSTTKAANSPNIIVIFCDDLGYGDLGVFGHPTIKTPNLDNMAFEGQKWTNFYAAASVCTPSRAGLMTGRLPIRNGMCSDKRRVLFPDSAGGLPSTELTIATLLKKQGYKTACVGKWHLGHLPQYLPTSHGFDSYFGIPYSNDMDSVAPKGTDKWRPPKVEYFNVPLMRDEDVIERPAEQNTITKRYTEEAVKIIKENRDNPFFLYLAHNLPHVPLFRSKEFADTSLRGLYGDVIEEIDNGVGKILKTLQEQKIDKNTLVIFTSDNGPWKVFDEQGGSSGILTGEKGATYEGGMREPTIFWWPGKIKPGVVMGMGSTLDVLPTACKIAGADVPNDRTMDGYDLTPVLFAEEKSPRNMMYYYRKTTVFALRKGAYKAHFITQRAYSGDRTIYEHNPPLLFNLEIDPTETMNIAEKHPDVLADIKKELEIHLASVEPVKDQLAERIKN
jgi:arylsulfatase A